MKNTLWTFGCSFTAEYYPVGQDFGRSNYDDYKDWRGGNLPDVWPTILSKKLNYNLQNRGIGASSNYTIFSQFIKSIEQIKKNDIVIIGWTSLLRYRISKKMPSDVGENKFADILPLVDFNDEFYEQTGFTKNTIDTILYNRGHEIWSQEVWEWCKIIKEYCKSKLVTCLFWTSDDLLFNQYIDKIIFDEYFIKTPDGNGDIFGYLKTPDTSDSNPNLKTTILAETLGDVKDVHFGEFGHIRQSNYFYNYLHQKNLL